MSYPIIEIPSGGYLAKSSHKMNWLQSEVKIMEIKSIHSKSISSTHEMKEVFKEKRGRIQLKDGSEIFIEDFQDNTIFGTLKKLKIFTIDTLTEDGDIEEINVRTCGYFPFALTNSSLLCGVNTKEANIVFGSFLGKDALGSYIQPNGNSFIISDIKSHFEEISSKSNLTFLRIKSISFPLLDGKFPPFLGDFIIDLKNHKPEEGDRIFSKYYDHISYIGVSINLQNENEYHHIGIGDNGSFRFYTKISKIPKFIINFFQ